MTNTVAPDPSARPPMVPLATLLGRELRGSKSEKPVVRFGHANLAKRGEDLFLIKPECIRVPGNSSSTFSVFAVFLAFVQFISLCFVGCWICSWTDEWDWCIFLDL